MSVYVDRTPPPPPPPSPIEAIPEESGGKRSIFSNQEVEVYETETLPADIIVTALTTGSFMIGTPFFIFTFYLEYTPTILTRNNRVKTPNNYGFQFYELSGMQRDVNKKLSV